MPASRLISEGACDGLERFSAYFNGFAFSPHRHDVYAIGVTTTGVQCFTYRGAARRSVAGRGFVLHPDELHDGRAGDDRGLGYRVIYIDPSLIREAAGTTSLPFVADPVVDDHVLIATILELLDAPVEADELARVSGLDALAHGLARIGRVPSRSLQIDEVGVAAARQALTETYDRRLRMSELEKVAGMSRWQLARQFRGLYGVSPYRFQLLQRLSRARDLLARGLLPIADVALICGFADQPHFARRFKQTYGMSPGRWRALCSG
jgi:AraC-like DNA-binding protein